MALLVFLIGVRVRFSLCGVVRRENSVIVNSDRSRYISPAPFPRRTLVR
jgi:hypothetical protein